MFALTDDQIVDAQKMAETPDLPNFSKAGTGKTHTTLEAIRLLKATTALVLCPKIGLDWWAEQAAEYLGAETKILRSAKTKMGADIHVTTYDIARSRKAELYENFNSGALVLDESQYVRRPDAGRTQAVFGKHLDGHGSLVSCFDTAWCLSGTPMEGYADDLWTQTGVLHPHIWEQHGIMDYDDFVNRFTYKRKKKFHPRMQPVWKISGNTNEAALNRIIYQEIGALRRQEAPGLPRLSKRNLFVPVHLTKDVRKAMDGLSPDQIIAAFNSGDEVMAKIWKIIGLSKVPEIVPYGVDIMKRGPLLLGCWHRDVMQAYDDEFTKLGFKVAQVHGGTPDIQREPIRKAFNEGNLDCIVGQMRAMGVSWNIQEACSNVVIAETYPGPAMIEQFYKRVYRFGQTKRCEVDLIVSNTSIDEALHGVMLRKGESDAAING